MTSETLFLRSCSPTVAFWDPARDRPSSQLFRTSSGDNGWLSVAHNGKTNAEKFYTEFTNLRGNRSRGIWAVSDEELSPVPEVQDAEGADVAIDYIEDQGDHHPTGHYLLDYTNLSNSLEKKVGRSLAKLAGNRGILYPKP